ncbi:hypothetical protein AX016_1448 [Cellulophaga sp. RHA19]|nr:hypothetical protein AX016_1448 [Cellulophaga sp. RHA19]
MNKLNLLYLLTSYQTFKTTVGEKIKKGMTDKEYKDIDDLLEWMSNDNLCVILKDLSDLRRKSINYCKSMGFIQVRVKTQFELSEKGYDVINANGLKNYLYKNNENKNLETELKKLQIDNLKYEKTIRSLKEQLLVINLIKAYKWYLGFIITIGIFLGYFLSLLIR